MKKAIVTTTINPPTKALLNFLKIAKEDDWHLFIVGDQKTPHIKYDEMDRKSSHVTYIWPQQQEDISKDLSALIGWNCIQRRNFGFIAAYRWGADVFATVDDDNIPLDNWGKNLSIGKETNIDLYSYKADVAEQQIVFDPLGPTTHGPNIWHRGFPIQLLKARTRLMVHKSIRTPLVQADLWNGAPDIDAICRINSGGNVHFNVSKFYAGNKPGPFNSQNTFLARQVIPFYFMFPHIGRMDDIFASYLVQARFPQSVVYGPASVYQERNPHDLVKDLKAEMIGYEHALDFAISCQNMTEGVLMPYPDYMPKESINAFEIYRGILKGD